MNDERLPVQSHTCFPSAAFHHEVSSMRPARKDQLVQVLCMLLDIPASRTLCSNKPLPLDVLL